MRGVKLTADIEFLQWMHDRIINVYGENKNVDFMHRFRSIIEAQKASGNMVYTKCQQCHWVQVRENVFSSWVSTCGAGGTEEPFSDKCPNCGKEVVKHF